MKIDHDLDSVFAKERKHPAKFPDPVAAPLQVTFGIGKNRRAALEELPPDQVSAPFFGENPEIFLIFQISRHCPAVLRRFLQRRAIHPGGRRFRSGNFKNADFAVIGHSLLSGIPQHQFEVSGIGWNPPRSETAFPITFLTRYRRRRTVSPVFAVFIKWPVVRNQFEAITEFPAQFFSAHHPLDRHHFSLEQRPVDCKSGSRRTTHPQKGRFSRLPDQLGPGRCAVFRVPLPDNARRLGGRSENGKQDGKQQYGCRFHHFPASFAMTRGVAFRS